MKLKIKTIHLNNLSLKVCSMIFGYFFWLMLVQNQQIKTSLNIPLYFFGLKENLEVIAPETIEILLSGKRIDLSNKNIINESAAHVDLTKYQTKGDYKLHLNDNDIFLHNKIKLINYYPTEIPLKIKDKS